MLPVIQILGRPVPVTILATLLALYIGIEVAAQMLGRLAPAEQRDGWRKAFSQAMVIGVAIGLVGARLGYAVQYYQLYVDSPMLLLSLRPGTLALLPGLLLGGAAALFQLAKWQVPLNSVADAGAVGLAAALLIIDVGNFLTGNAYGTETAVPWGVHLWNAMRHPVQLYDAAALLAVLGTLWYLRKHLFAGELFWRFLLLYSVSSLFLGMFYATSTIWGPGIRLSQVIALGMLLVSLFVLSFFAQQRDFAQQRGVLDSETSNLAEM